jgi:hypothetical protein
VTAGVDGSVDPEDAALDNLRDRRPGVLGDGVPVPSLVDQGVRGDASGDPFKRTVRRLAPAELRQEVAARGVDQQLVVRGFTYKKINVKRDAARSRRLKRLQAWACPSQYERDERDTWAKAPYARALLREDAEGSVMGLCCFHVLSFLPTS